MRKHADHVELLFRFCFHREETRFDLVVSGEWGFEWDLDYLFRTALQLAGKSHALHSKLSFFSLSSLSFVGDVRDGAYFGIDGGHFGAGDRVVELTVPFSVRHEGVGMIRHVHPQETRFVGDRISHCWEMVVFREDCLSVSLSLNGDFLF